MNLEKIFKNLIILELILLVLSIAVTVYLEWVEWDVPIEEGFDPVAESLIMILTLIVVIAYYVNLYFLYKFKSIGKTLYVPLLILILILDITLGNDFDYRNIEVILEWFGGLLSGMIIALLYFSDIKDKFKQT